MKKTKLTIKQMFIKLMISEWTTVLSGQKETGSYKLSARVSEIEKAKILKIKKRKAKSKNRWGDYVEYMEYKIVKPSKKALAKYGL
jgi:hypothetical protein